MSFYANFSSYYERIFPFKQQTYAFLKQYLPQPNAHVLDIGCGTGHYSGKFAQEGAYVVGIDLDQRMIAYAQQHYPEALFFCLDMRQIETLQERFDLIYSIGNVVSHLPQDQFMGFLGRLYNILSPEGSWIFQTVNWNRILNEKCAEFPIREFENGKIRFLRSYSQISEQHVTFRTILESHGKIVFDEETMLYPCTTRDVIDFHKNCGFKCVANYGSYQKSSYQEASASASIFAFQKSSSGEA